MAKRTIEWSIEAKESLQEILEYYIERNGNKRYSAKLLQHIKQTILHIKTNNFIGKATDEHQTRVMFKSHYGIFYEVKEKIIEIQLVWDTRRNPEDFDI